MRVLLTVILSLMMLVPTGAQQKKTVAKKPATTQRSAAKPRTTAKPKTAAKPKTTAKIGKSKAKTG